MTFHLLYAFLVVGHGRRQLLWFDVTRHPTAQWLARQMTEAFPWASAPTYLVRDNDRARYSMMTVDSIMGRPLCTRVDYRIRVQFSIFRCELIALMNV